MTKQELFDKVAAHLLTQKKRAMGLLTPGSETLKCVYRAPDGCTCAIGSLIPDEVYIPDMEGCSACILIRKIPALEQIIGLENAGLAAQLQRVHDCTLPIFWREELNKVAAIYGLNSDVLNQKY